MPDPILQTGIVRPESARGLNNLLFNSGENTVGNPNINEADAAVANAMREINTMNKSYSPMPIRSSLQTAVRYDDSELGYNPSRADQEDLYAKHQTILGSVGNGLARFATTALTKAGTGLAYVGSGIINAFGGNEGNNFEERFNSWMSRTADNALSTAIQSFEDNQLKNDWFAIYQEAKDRDKGLFARALTDLNFWTEDFIDGFAFMASAYIPGMAIGKLGMGVNAVKALNALGLGRDVMATAETAASTVSELAKSASTLRNNYEAINKIPQVAKWISNAKLARNLDVGVTTIISTASEAMFEATDTKNKVIDSLTGKINPNTGIEYTPEEIKREAAVAARNTFAMNLAALSLSNLWEANLLFKRLPSTAAEAGEHVAYEAGVFGKASYVKPNRILEFGKKAAEGTAVEGFWEENVQLAIQRYNESKAAPNYKNKRYSSSVLDNYLQGTIGAITGEDKEAAMSIGLGALMGAVVGGSLSTREDIKKDRGLNSRINNYNSVIESFKALKDVYETEDQTIVDAAGNTITQKNIKRGVDNKPVVNQEKLNAWAQGSVERTRLLDLMHQSRENGNESMANMLEHELFSAFAAAHFELGNAEGLHEKLDALRNGSDEDFNMMGWDTSNREQAASKIAGFESKAKVLQELYDNIEHNVIPSKDEALDGIRKKKLYELGARQIFLTEEAKRLETKANIFQDIDGVANDYNKLRAKEKSLETRLDGMLAMKNNDDIDLYDGSEAISETEKELNKTRKEKAKYEEDNKESLDAFEKDDSGYLFNPNDEKRNSIRDRQTQRAREDYEGIVLALKDTTNKFNKIADIRKGEKFTKEYVVRNATDTPEKYKDINEKDIDVNNLNNKLETILDNVRYKPLLEENFNIGDHNIPLVKRLDLLTESRNPLAKEILDAFSKDIDEAVEAIAKEKKIREDLEKQREINEEAEKSGSSNTSENSNATDSPEWAKKNIVQIASTVPIDDDIETENNNYHRRHGRFLNRLTSGKIKNADKQKVIIVSRNNEGSLNLPGFIPIISVQEDPAKDILAAVSVIQDGDDLFYVDEYGEKLGKVGEAVDYNKIIYSQLASDELKVKQDGSNRYTGLGDHEIIRKWWVETRKSLLGLTSASVTPHDYAISAGRLNPDLYTNEFNTLQDAKIISDEDIEKPIVEVATFDRMSYKNTNGVPTVNAEAKVTPGKVYINQNGSIIPVDNAKFTDEEIDNIFNILLRLSREIQDKPAGEVLNSTEKRFLNNILYFNSPKETDGQARQIGTSQIWIQNGLNFPHADTGARVNIPFQPSSIVQNEALIKDFLRSAFHQVENGRLLKDRDNPEDSKFYETRVDREGNISTIEWPSYQSYLLSTTDPSGNKRSPKLKIRQSTPINQESPIVGRYIMPISSDIFTPSISKEELSKIGQQEEKKKSEKPVGTAAKSDQLHTFTSGKSGATITYTGPSTGIKSADDINIKEDDGFMQHLEFMMTDPSANKVLESAKKQIVAQKPSAVDNEDLLNNEAAKTVIQRGIFATLPKVDEEATSSNNIEEAAKQINETEGVDEQGNENISEIIDKAVDDLLKEANGDDVLDGQTRMVADELFSDYTPMDISAERAWWKERFSVGFETLPHLINTTNGGKAWGILHRAMVYVYEKAPAGTSYHEAFEVVWNMFLTGKEQMSLYKEFVGRKQGSFRTYKGEYKTFASADLQEAKEQMAEEFRDYILTGKLPAEKSRNAIQRIFKKILDWIKNVFTNKERTDDLVSLFKKINSKAYKNATPLKSYDPETKNYSRVPNAPEVFVQDMMHAMSEKVFEDAFSKDSALIQALEEGKEDALKTLYSDLYNKLEYEFKNNVVNYFKQKLSSAKTENERNFLKKQLNDIVLGDGKNGNAFGWQFAKDNWTSFIEEHKRFLRTFDAKVLYDEDNDESVSGNDYEEEDSDESGKTMSDYDSEIFSYNPKRTAPKYVRFLLATMAQSEYSQIFRDRWNAIKDYARMKETIGTTASSQDLLKSRRFSTIAMPKLVEYGKLFNYILHNTSNHTSIHSIYDRLKTLSADSRIKKNADVYRLVNRMKFTVGFAGKTIEEAKGILKLENTLLKQKPEFFAQYHKADGKVIIERSNFSTRTKQLAQEWIENLKSAPFTKMTQNGLFQFSGIPYIDSTSQDTLVLFAREIGITQLTDDAFENLSSEDRIEILKNLSAIRSVFKQASKQPMFIITGKSLDVQSRFEKIADHVVNNIIAEDNEGQHTNINGKPTSNFVLNNWVSYILNHSIELTDKQEFFKRLPWLDNISGDIFSRDSKLINEKLFDNKNAGKIRLGITEGRHSDRYGNKSLSKMSIEERTLYEVNNNLMGIFNVLINGDGKSEWIINTGNYIPLALYSESSQRDKAKKMFYDQMFTYLQTEIALAKDYENRKHIEALSRQDKSTGRPLGKSLRFFKGILSEKTVKAINERVIDGDENIEDVLSGDDVQKEIEAFVTASAKKTAKTLANYGFITNDGKDYYVNGIVTDVKDRILGKGDKVSGEGVVDLLLYRQMNYMISNMEMYKTFFGDPLQFKDAEKRIKSFLSGRESTYYQLEDGSHGFNELANNKLNEGLEKEDIGYTVFRNNLKHISFRDVFAQSEYKDLIESKINKELSKKYDETNEADAHSLMIGTAYRQFLYKAGGRFLNKQEDLFQWHMAYERFIKNKKGEYTYSSGTLEQADIKTLGIKSMAYQPLSDELREEIKKSKPRDAYFHVLKPIISGIVYENGVAKTHLIKTSTSPLFYEWVEGTHLEEIYNQMSNNDIDFASFESAHKVGISSDNTIELYNEEGKINSEGFKSVKKGNIPFNTIGIQVENSNIHEKNTQATQLNKLDVSDLYDSGKPIDYTGSIEQWNKLSEEEQLKQSRIHRIAKELTDSKNALNDLRYENMLKEFDIKTDDGINFSLGEKGREKMTKFILGELERRELPKNISEAIASGNTEYETIASYKQIKDIIYSAVQKRLVRPTINGGQHTLIPVTGWEHVKKEKVNGKNVLVSSTIKFYNVGKDGRTEACQIYLPNKFKGIPIGKISRDVLKGIGFRIPTQGLNSVEYFEVAGFLPEDMGDVVIFPSEITTKAGSDFDIDKMNMYLKNWYRDTDGIVKQIKWQGSLEETRKYVESIVDSGVILSKEERQKAREYIELGMNESINNLMNNIFDVDDIPTHEELMIMFLDENNLRGKMIDRLMIKSLENRYIDSLIDVISLPENLTKLISPNTVEKFTDGSKGLKKIAEDIKTLKGENEEYSDPTNLAKMVDSNYVTAKRHEFITGKDIVGVSAVSNTNLSINQLAGVKIPLSTVFDTKLSKLKLSDLPFKFNIVTIDGVSYISLGGLTSVDSNISISNSGSQYIDGGVDISKDPWIISLLGNPDLASAFLLMNKAGVHPEVYSMFFNQPAIQEYIANKQKNRTQVELGIKRRFISNYANREQIRNKFATDQMVIKPTVYNIQEMKTMIEKYAKGQPFTNYEKGLQKHMLDDFLTIDAMRWDLFNFIQKYNYDTQKVNDPNLFLKKDITNEKENKISGINDVFSKSFLGNTKDKVVKINNIFSNLYFKLHTGKSQTFLYSVANELLNKRFKPNNDKFKSLMSKAEMSLLTFLIQTGNKINGKTINRYFKKLILDKDTNTARWIEAIKKSKDETLSKNPFIERLIPSVLDGEGMPKTVYMNEAEYDPTTSDILTASIQELFDGTKTVKIGGEEKKVSDIMENLLLTGILQTGAGRTRGSFIHLFPQQIYNKYVNSITTNEDFLDMYIENDMFYRTNWMNDDFVAPLREDDIWGATRESKILMVRATTENINNQFMKRKRYNTIVINGKDTVDYDNPVIYLYKRVDSPDGSPLIKEIDTSTSNDPEWQDSRQKAKIAYYRPMIKWGDKYTQEFLLGVAPSLLRSNNNVTSEPSYLEALKAIRPDLAEQMEAFHENPVATTNTDPIDDEGEQSPPSPTPSIKSSEQEKSKFEGVIETKSVTVKPNDNVPPLSFDENDKSECGGGK